MSLQPAVSGFKKLNGTDTNPSLFDEADSKVFGFYGEADIDLVITDTTEPASPQFSRTLQQSDFPKGILGFNMQDFYGVFTYQVENVGITETLNCKSTKNGVASLVESRSITNTRFARGAQGNENGNMDLMKVGDVVGLKFWNATTSNFTIRNVAFWLVPKTLVVNAIVITCMQGAYVPKDAGSIFAPTTYASPAAFDYFLFDDNSINQFASSFEQTTCGKGTILLAEVIGNFMNNETTNTIAYPHFLGFGRYGITK